MKNWRSGSASIVHYGRGGDSNMFSLRGEGGRFWIDIYSTTEFGNTDTIWDGSSHQQDTWHFVAIAYDGGQSGTSMVGYHDGSVSRQGRPERMPHTELGRPIYVNHDEGDNNGNGADYWVDDVAFFDSFVSAEDIAAIWNDGQGMDISLGAAGQAECANGCKPSNVLLSHLT